MKGNLADVCQLAWFQVKLLRHTFQVGLLLYELARVVLLGVALNILNYEGRVSQQRALEVRNLRLDLKNCVLLVIGSQPWHGVLRKP